MAVEGEPTRWRRSIGTITKVALVVPGVIAGLLLGELGYRSAGYSAPIKAHGPGPNPRFYFKADPVNGYEYVVLLKQHSVQALDTRRILEIGHDTGY